MSTQEVPEWLSAELEQLFYPTKWANSSGKGIKWTDCDGVDVTDDVNRLIQTILSHMIDKQKVEEVLRSEGVYLWPKSLKPKKTLQNRDVSVRNKLRSEIRQALNLNGDERSE